MSRDLPKFVRFFFVYNPRRPVSRPRRRRKLIETTGRSRNIVEARAARPLYYHQVVAPRWRPSSHRARRRRRSSRWPRRNWIIGRPSCSRASSRGRLARLRLHSRSPSRRRRRRRCFVKLRRRGASFVFAFACSFRSLCARAVFPRSRARARANGLYLNLSGAVKSFGCSAAGVGAKLRYSAVVLHGCFTAQKSLGRGGDC